MITYSDEDDDLRTVRIQTERLHIAADQLLQMNQNRLRRARELEEV
jgi:hypothetical protein